MLKVFQVIIEVEEDDDNQEAVDYLKEDVSKDTVEEAVSDALDFECDVRVTEITPKPPS